MTKPLKDGYYRFTSERSSQKCIAQLLNHEWYLIGEERPVTMAEMNRRGWTVDTRVGKMKIYN
jgi:hypothetical protein